MVSLKSSALQVLTSALANFCCGPVVETVGVIVEKILVHSCQYGVQHGCFGFITSGSDFFIMDAICLLTSVSVTCGSSASL